MDENVKEIMDERFGRDALIALATVDGNMPSVRTVDAYYEDGVFYVITHALSNKMKQIKENPNVGVSGEWFTAHGIGCNLGWVQKKENEPIAKKLTVAFQEWIGNGHTDLADENTVILSIELSDGILFHQGVQYILDFSHVHADKDMMAFCGAYCGVCEWKDAVGCKGCKAQAGEMFWGECDKAKCCIGKGHAHCGECASLPCQMLLDLFADPEHGDQGERLRNLQGWKKGAHTFERLNNAAQEQARTREKEEET